jgi:adenine-specific DNA-methyltransferase
MRFLLPGPAFLPGAFPPRFAAFRHGLHGTWNAENSFKDYRDIAMTMTTYDGRLELTWTNKPLRLLAHDDGRYEWLPPADYRIAEVRLLSDAGAVGEVHAPKERAKDNLLIRGDALNALTSLAALPEFTREYLGRVKLVYIDPPFNSGEAFEHYEDNLEHSVWLTMIRDRLKQIERLLAPDGSVWVHLNDDESHYAKVVMDELFTRKNFVATFIWQKVDSPNDNKVPIRRRQEITLTYRERCGRTIWR